MSVVSVAVTALAFLHPLSLNRATRILLHTEKLGEGHATSIIPPNYDLSAGFSFVIVLHSAWHLMTSKHLVSC